MTTATVPLLEFDSLRVTLPLGGTQRTVIHRVDLALAAGSAVGLVGESGSGKSLTARSVLGLLPEGARIEGDVRFDGASVPAMRQAELRTLRSRHAAMVFQDPRTHINPLRTVGDFLTEALVSVRREPRAQAEAKVVALLREVHVADAERRMRQRPSELSGGLLQRVMIASALAVEPRLLLADEPTTALDVTTQAEVMAIIDEARENRGLTLLFITHDLALAAAVCDRIAVMYAGHLVEELPARRLVGDAAHRYTRALLASRPDPTVPDARLRAVDGRPLSAFEAGPGCPFAPRCAAAQELCHRERPEPRAVADGRAACHFPHAVDPQAVDLDAVDPHAADTERTAR
ncbi:ABC transporter ATP-binding protein [Streptacidiphilus jiangxiensis]|uniref:Oligopeptide/dipeptide ABC transporter, ATP-binding protein, C-terminal domain-containing protein n=1 Tax=Streptacidiphilus jiangxiensis TaxID=235985 RepID=A0A1H7HEJ9_STRJI|nr:ABC transporter ATP-binding protein [Streptacidiphilus jiangxiensis]SEK48658.1 oligopeptide/dipeptide ABC transporter, ATP-binding protein, C-terminal domain-containing protein [Streptacidiphilus jiangxiensis]